VTFWRVTGRVYVNIATVILRAYEANVYAVRKSSERIFLTRIIGRFSNETDLSAPESELKTGAIGIFREFITAKSNCRRIRVQHAPVRVIPHARSSKSKST